MINDSCSHLCQEVWYRFTWDETYPRKDDVPLVPKASRKRHVDHVHGATNDVGEDAGAFGMVKASETPQRDSVPAVTSTPSSATARLKTHAIFQRAEGRILG